MNYQNILSNFFQNGHVKSSLFEERDIKIDNRYKRVKEFLMKDNFNGFSSDDLFIMQFIKKGWGQDIAALSNMAEAMVNLSTKNPMKMDVFGAGSLHKNSGKADFGEISESFCDALL